MWNVWWVAELLYSLSFSISLSLCVLWWHVVSWTSPYKLQYMYTDRWTDSKKCCYCLKFGSTLMPRHYSIQYIFELHHEVYVGSSCHSLAMKTASCPANCRQPFSRSWRRGKTSWTKWMEMVVKVCTCNESTSDGSVVSARMTWMNFIQLVPHQGQQADLSSLLSEGFVRFFVELVGHYGLHMVESSNGSRELQRDSFRKSHPSRGVRQFLQLFMDTQMFAGFIQDKELAKGGARGTWHSNLSLKAGFYAFLQNRKLHRPMGIVSPLKWTCVKYKNLSCLHQA